MENANTERKKLSRPAAALRFVICSALGIFMFFINVPINGVSTNPLQHIYNWLYGLIGPAVPYIAMLFVFAGAIIPFARKTWNKDLSSKIFSILKVFGAVVAVMAAFGIGPALFQEPDYLPFLWDNLVLSITLMSVIYIFGYIPFMYYGLVEFVGAIMQRFMRAVFHTPGQSAMDALISTISAYGTANLVTNRMYKGGMYTTKEAAIISTGFSTVAIAFMLVVANVVGCGNQSSLFLLTCILATFGSTAITCRIWPLSKFPDTYYDKPAPKIPDPKFSEILPKAWKEGVDASQNARPLPALIKEYFVDAMLMLTSQVASILSIGLIGIFLADKTPIFDIIGYIFYPFTLLFQIPEPLIAAKGAAIEIAEMFLPAAIVSGAPPITAFTVGVTSISAVIFFSACVPAILATEIPIKIKDLLIIWFERTVCSLGIASLMAHIFLN